MKLCEPVAQCDESSFDVGCYPTYPPVRFDDRIEACAVFVRFELASIAGVGPLPK